mmetsp:Transcript_32334/g.84636  ORF Transcript_32334/g.84636 Transcript_32334/m.84636 type:complete len:216 (+) Transcript_32334:1125-1772(+)
MAGDRCRCRCECECGCRRCKGRYRHEGVGRSAAQSVDVCEWRDSARGRNCRTRSRRSCVRDCVGVQPRNGAARGRVSGTGGRGSLCPRRERCRSCGGDARGRRRGRAREAPPRLHGPASISPRGHRRRHTKCRDRSGWNRCDRCGLRHRPGLCCGAQPCVQLFGRERRGRQRVLLWRCRPCRRHCGHRHGSLRGGGPGVGGWRPGRCSCSASRKR